MDEIDARLLLLLEANARQSAVSLARAVGLSRSAVQERLAKLEGSGEIAGYTIVRGERRSSRRTQALLFVQIATRPCETVIRRFRDWPEIKACWSVAGEIDAVLLVQADEPGALSDLGDRLAAVPGVASVTTTPILRTVLSRIEAQAGSGA